MRQETGIVKTSELLKERYTGLPLSNIYKQILGKLPKEVQWTMLVHGIAGSGKSTYSLVLACELVRFGKILYGNFEEQVGPTLQNKMQLVAKKSRSLDIGNKIHFLSDNTEEGFWHCLDSGLYKYAIVDSLSQIANTQKKVVEFFSRLRFYPNVSFILISHARRARDGKRESDYKGMSEIGHLVDVNQRVVEGVVWNDKNRYLGRECSHSAGFDIFRRAMVRAR